MMGQSDTTRLMIISFLLFDFGDKPKSMRSFGGMT